MSEDEGSTTDQSSAYPEGSDPTLASLSSLVNKLERETGVGVSFGLTLVVGGSLISGMILSGSAWWKLNSDNISQKLPVDGPSFALAEALGDRFDRISEVYGRPDYMDNEYLHLRDVRFFVSGLQPDNLHLRFRINEIQGWSFGELTPVQIEL